MKKAIITVVAALAFICMSSVAFATEPVDNPPQDQVLEGTTDTTMASGYGESGESGQKNVNDYDFSLSKTKFYLGDDYYYPEVICNELEEDVDYYVEYEIDRTGFNGARQYNVYITGNGEYGAAGDDAVFGEKILTYKVVSTTISLNKTSATLYRQGTLQLTATVTNKNGETTYSSSNNSVATVSSAGKITAKGKGTATITARNGYANKTMTVTVKNPTLNISSTSLYVKGTKTLTITGKVGTPSFVSSNNSVATVTSTGKIVAKKKGTCTITAKSNGLNLKCTVTVNNPKLNITKTSLYVKGMKTLSITGRIGKATFVSSNKNIATVTSTGKIVAKKKGTCTITAKTNGINLKCTVTVNNPKLNFTKASVFVKGTKTLKITGKIGKATFKSSNNNIAVVNSAGKITTKKKGACTITVRANGVDLKCKVTVKNPYLNKKTVTIVKNKTDQLIVNGKIGTATFKSSNNKIATVNASGVIKGKKKGKCTITVKSNGVTLKCKVTVKNPPPVYVYITRTGKRYHCDPDCWGLRSANALYKVTLQKAKGKGLTPCHVCYGY